MGENFMTYMLNIVSTKASIDKQDVLKVKNFCRARETINRVNRQLTEWEKIYVCHASDKGLISRIYKEFKQINKLKNKQHTN